MLTKKKIAELIRLRLSGGDIGYTNKVDERDIYEVTSVVISSLIAADYKDSMMHGSFDINGSWLKTFENVQVKESTSRKEFYIDLPAYLVSLPSDRGLRMVCPMEDQSTQYTVTNNNSAAVFSDLEAGAMQRTCYIEGNRVYFPKWTRGCCKVLVKMIPSVDTLTENELLPIPGIMEDMLLEKVYAKFKDQTFMKEKKTNDANANTI